jgi:uroporphyrinogen-III synthase
MPFNGQRVLALESRRASETAQLIRNQGGEPFVAPSMREVPLEANDDAFAFAERLFRGEFDMMIFLTGVGCRTLHKVLATRHGEERFPGALRKLTTVARGPKPVAALREMNVPVTVTVPEPNTWRELLAALDGQPERRIAVQEYGRSNTELLDALRARGAEVSPVRVYQWDRPENLEPLRDAVRRLADKSFDVVLFSSSIQLEHLLETAAELGLREQAIAGLDHALIGSIGPTMTETLKEQGLRPAVIPSHPKLGLLVRETAERAGAPRDETAAPAQ